MRPISRIATALLLAVDTAGAAGCGGSSGTASKSQDSAAPAVHPTVAALCASWWQGGKGKQVWFTSAHDASIGGVELGTGTTGVVLAHASGAGTCEWLPYGTELAAAGYRVLAFDFSGYGASQPAVSDDPLDADVVAAAKFLRGEGVTTVVFIGSSMGGTASLVAATELAPPVAGVISLSGPTSHSGVDASVAVPKLTVPVLYAVGSDDVPFAANAQTLYDATPGSAKSLLVIKGSGQHGSALLASDAPDSAKVRKAIQDFLKAHAPIA